MAYISASTSLLNSCVIINDTILVPVINWLIRFACRAWHMQSLDSLPIHAQFMSVVVWDYLGDLLPLGKNKIKTHGRVSAAKKAMWLTSVLFTGTANLPFSAPHISITTGPICIKFTYFMPSIYATLHSYQIWKKSVQ